MEKVVFHFERVEVEVQPEQGHFLVTKVIDNSEGECLNCEVGGGFCSEEREGYLGHNGVAGEEGQGSCIVPGSQSLFSLETEVAVDLVHFLESEGEVEVEDL